MLRLHDVFDLGELGLRPVFTPSGPSPEIRWAHVSELVDPSPWLLGQELLLTTGVALEDDAQAWLDYCRRLKNARVSALGISTGETLPYGAVPTKLVESARAVNLALVSIPHDTLMQSVVSGVSDALHYVANQSLIKSYLLQRQLSEAASSHAGTDRIVESLARLLQLETVVFDERLKVLVSSSSQAEQRVAAMRDDLKGLLRRGVRWSYSGAEQDEARVVLPLGTEGRLSGILVSSKSGELTIHDRAALGLAASLLGILLERRESTHKHRRILEAQLLAALLSDSSAVGELTDYLQQRGVEVSDVVVLSLGENKNEADVDECVASLLEICEEILVLRTTERVLFALINSNQLLIEPTRVILDRLGLGPAGIGERRPLDRIGESRVQADFARSIAVTRDVTLLSRAETGGYRALMLIGSSDTRARFADSVLEPLVNADRTQRGDLLSTARAYIAALCNHEATADALGVHRHTVRARLARITQITGRDLTRAEDLLELWMALEFQASEASD